jgi:hypothetical protein
MLVSKLLAMIELSSWDFIGVAVLTLIAAIVAIVVPYFIHP